MKSITNKLMTGTNCTVIFIFSSFLSAKSHTFNFYKKSSHVIYYYDTTGILKKFSQKSNNLSKPQAACNHKNVYTEYVIWSKKVHS